MPRTPKPALRKPKPRSPRPTSRLPISAHGICPFRAPSFFLRNFFLRPAPMPRLCTDAGRMLPGAGRWEFGPRGEGAGAPGWKSGSESGAGLRDRVRVGLRAGAAKAGCRSRVPRAASDRRKQGPEGVFCTAGSDVSPAKAPHAAPGLGKSAGRPAAGPAVPGPGSGSAAGSGSCGCFRGPGAAADSGAGFRESRRGSCSAAVPAAGFRGPRLFRGHAPEGVFRARTGGAEGLPPAPNLSPGGSVFRGP